MCSSDLQESEEVAVRLGAAGIGCQVLNAVNDQREAELVAKAGMKGAVTVSTNMAGRGTDIKLGGETGEGRDEIVALGGLYVIGTNRHESVRIDDQLRGRAGRQGDPGSSRFFVSLEDDIVRRYAILDLLPERHRTITESIEVDDRVVRHEIVRAQSIIEEQHASMRRTLRNYSRLLENQRRYRHELRRAALLYGKLPETVAERCAPRLAIWREHGLAREGTALLARLFLRELDESWAEHLAEVEEIREGIHLQRLGQRNPLMVFIEAVSQAFDRGLNETAERVVECFSRIEPSESRARYAHEIQGPSSTWTYLINDDPFPAFRLSLVSAGNPAGALVAAAVALVRVLAAPLEWIARLAGRNDSNRNPRPRP